MGSNIMCLPLHEEARKYIQELKPNEIFPKEQPRDLTYEDLGLIFNQLKQWGWYVGINGKASGNFDVDIFRDINGDEGRTLYITLWVTEKNRKPDVIFHKGRHSVGLFIAREIAKLCGPQCVLEDFDGGTLHVVTGNMDLTALMKNWLSESLYGDYWQTNV